MNQAIIFSDDVTWNEKDQCLIFIAQVSGQVVECVVSHQKLQQSAQRVVSSVEEAFIAFEISRFDLEEEAEELIKNDGYNEFGQIILD